MRNKHNPEVVVPRHGWLHVFSPRFCSHRNNNTLLFFLPSPSHPHLCVTHAGDFALTSVGREAQQNNSSPRLLDILLDTTEHNMTTMRQRKTVKRSLMLACGVLLAMGVTTTAFTPTARFSSCRPTFTLHETASSSSAESLPEISEMKLKDIRQELESYGISTKAFLEKPEFIAALEKARKEGMKPKKKSVSKEQPSSANGASGKTRDERIEEEMKVAKSMSVADLRKELNSRSIKTNAFFEKSDFVKAYAEAIVDGVKEKSSSSSRGGTRRTQEEEYDSSYRDVQCRKLDRNTRQALTGTVIDIRTK